MTSSKIFRKLNIFFSTLFHVFFLDNIVWNFWLHLTVGIIVLCLHHLQQQTPYHYFIHLQFPITSYSTISSIVGFLLLLNEIFTDTFWGMLVCLLAYAGCSIIQPLGLLWQPQITGLNSAEERHVSTIYIFDKLLEEVQSSTVSYG